jgi:AcrR family transcriptional regulator/DNA-binding MarR family transcriptional regulator
VPSVCTRVKSPARSDVGEARRRAVRGSCESFPRGQLVEIQRSRLLAGAVGAIDELGYANTTVEHITSRARVSRRTFYELFENREACLLALLDDVLGTIAGELAAANLGDLGWRERVRDGLWTILSFCDREPALARVCVVQALRGGLEVSERREEILSRLAAAIDEGRLQSARGGECTVLTAEGLVGAAFAIVHGRLLHKTTRPLTGLVGELMGLIVLPYCGSAAARRERARAAPTLALAAREPATRVRQELDPLREIPMRLTYRTARVLECIAVQPGASNRQVAERAGISDQGQVSKLLARLQRLGLTANTGVGHTKGEPNAWKLTPLGHKVEQRLSTSAHDDRQAA